MDDVDRQNEIEARLKEKRKQVDSDVGKRMKVQLRKVIVHRRVNCPVKNRPVGLDGCRLCKENAGVGDYDFFVQCKVVTQNGRAVEVSL